MKSVRYTTLVKRYGQPTFLTALNKRSLDRYHKAVRENRVITVHHRESDWCAPEWAEVGHFVFNVLVRLIFPRPLPYPKDTLVLGVKKHYDPSPALK